MEHPVRHRLDANGGDGNPFIAALRDHGRNHLRVRNIRNSISLTLAPSHRIISAQPGRREVAGPTTCSERSFRAGLREAGAFRANGGALPNTRC
jgi:hypothetical protein